MKHLNKGVFTFKVASIFFTLLVVFQFGVFCNSAWPKKMVVNVSVANLKDFSGNSKITSSEIDNSQVSQLLFGENIIAYEEKNGWLKVKCLDQKLFAANSWDFFRGWIKSNKAIEVNQHLQQNLTVRSPLAQIQTKGVWPHGNQKIFALMGSKLCGTQISKYWYKLFLPCGRIGFISATSVTPANSKFVSRKQILDSAKMFLGRPYFWGGRSFYSPFLMNQKTGVDCSGFVEICHAANGIDIPRNTVSQYESSAKLNQVTQPGDLIFIATNNDCRSIRHATIYEGEDSFFETVRKIGDLEVGKTIRSCGQDRFGKKICQLRSGDRIKGGFIFFGSFLS
jgi:hypothetical protein